MTDNAKSPCKLAAADGSPMCPTSEAVRGLAANRGELLRARHRLLDNPIWQGYREHWEKLTAEIEATDKRIDALLANYSANDKMRERERQ